ncbi:hypothetical protein MASR1M46_08650 [Bacteroidales bacterium]
MNNFPAALTAAELVITSNKYSLYTNDKWVASWSSEFGSESIFEIAVNKEEADLGTLLGYYLMRKSQKNRCYGLVYGERSFLSKACK